MADAMTQFSNNNDQTAMQRLSVDAEHGGIRFAIPVLAILGFVLVVWLGPVLFNVLGLGDSFFATLLIPLAIGFAILAAFIGERVLKQVWPSGREIVFDERSLILRNKKQENVTMRLQDRINVLAWRFTVARRGRVPKGHYCMAFQVLQDEMKFTVYTFFSPRDLEAFTDAERFTPLSARRNVDDERLNIRVAGEQRRLLQAEDDRWRDGAELSRDDFSILWARILLQQNQVK